ncbi:hypothetical protein OIU76_017207 [Salix suchowensis]|nr:hypothetical protein OIU76_017207 [Salix suchowensis]
MSVSKLTRKDYISDVPDRFVQLPDELIITILKRTKDAKTLIRCTIVCKRLQCLVTKVDSVVLRFSYPGEAGAYLPCWKSHYHIPQSAFPALMKLFVDLKALEIKLCLCPSLLPCYYGVSRRRNSKFLLKSVDMNDKMHTHMYTAFDIGSLLGADGRISFLESNMLYIGDVKSSLMLSFFLVILCHRPKTLRTVVILGAENYGSGSSGNFRSGSQAQDRSEGNVFMEPEHFARFRELSSKTTVDENWLKDPQNLVCWLENHEENKHQLAEKLWLIHKWEGERCNMNESTVKKSDVEELLRSFDEGMDGDNENGDFFRMELPPAFDEGIDGDDENGDFFEMELPPGFDEGIDEDDENGDFFDMELPPGFDEGIDEDDENGDFFDMELPPGFDEGIDEDDENGDFFLM